jgi:hypothetical protein
MMARLTWFFPVLLLVMILPVAAARQEGRTVEDLTIHLDGDLLTLKAQQVPHRQILEHLARQLDFELIVAGPLEERRSLDIESRPWEEALKRALAPASWAFVYRASTGEPQLAKVFVFPPKGDSVPTSRTSGAVSGPPRPRPGPAPVADAPAAAESPQAEGAADIRLSEMLESEDEETRALALVGLATMGGEQAITALTQALQDREPWIRETAVEGLAEIGGEQAIQGLEQALRDGNAEVRKAAEEALSRLRPNQR